MAVQQYVIRRDTAAWNMQVWLSFGLAVMACVIGVWNMPSQELDRAFLALGFFFCLFATLAVAKMVRDNRDEEVDTASWKMTVWVAFVGAFALTAWGLLRISISSWEKGYLLVSWLFLVSVSFTLAKTIRDKHEADMVALASEIEQPPAPQR